MADRATALLHPEPGSIFAEAPARAAWKDTPSTYIAGSDDKAIRPEMVAQSAQRCAAALTWPTGHSPYLSQPQRVVDLVRDHL